METMWKFVFRLKSETLEIQVPTITRDDIIIVAMQVLKDES